MCTAGCNCSMAAFSNTRCRAEAAMILQPAPDMYVCRRHKVQPRLIKGQLNVSGLVWQQLDGQNHRPCSAEVGDNKEGSKSKWAGWVWWRGQLRPCCGYLTFIYLDFMWQSIKVLRLWMTAVNTARQTPRLPPTDQTHKKTQRPWIVHTV